MFAITSTFSWQSSVSLCLASFCTPRPNVPLSRYLLIFYFAFLSPMLKRTFFGIHSRRSYYQASLIAQLVKNIPAMQETPV